MFDLKTLNSRLMPIIDISTLLLSFILMIQGLYWRLAVSNKDSLGRINKYISFVTGLGVPRNC